MQLRLGLQSGYTSKLITKRPVKALSAGERQIMASKQTGRALTDKVWVRLFFTYPALTPVAWWVSALLSAGLLFWASWRLIPASFPHWLMLGLMLLTAWLNTVVEGRIYRSLAPLYDGGWMPSLQKTLLTLGLFALLAVVAYVCWLQLYLGIGLFVALAFYAWRYLPHEKDRQSPLRAFSDLVNSTQRVEAPGIRQAEKLCLWACLLIGLCTGAGLLDMLITTGHPVHQVRLLGKEVRSGSKGSRSYNLSLSGWRRSSQVIELQVSQSEFNRLIPAADYEMQTRRGLFGSERLETFRVRELGRQ